MAALTFNSSGSRELRRWTTSCEEKGEDLRRKKKNQSLLSYTVSTESGINSCSRKLSTEQLITWYCLSSRNPDISRKFEMWVALVRKDSKVHCLFIVPHRKSVRPRWCTAYITHTNTQCFASRLENNTSTFFFEICSILIENHASCFTLFSFTKNQQFKLLKVFICTPCLKSVCISPTCTFVAKYSSVRKRKKKKDFRFNSQCAKELSTPAKVLYKME